MPVVSKGPLGGAGSHDQADRGARDHTLQVGASGRRAVSGVAVLASVLDRSGLL